MADPAFKNGLPLFKNGLPCFGCGTCGGCATLSGTDCSSCGAAGTTPASIEAVLSGITGVCCVHGVAGISPAYKAIQATVTGTYTLTHAITAACDWEYGEVSAGGTGYTFYSTTLCGGGTANTSWEIHADTQDQTAQGRGVVLRVRVFLKGTTGGIHYDLRAQPVFAGQASFTACTGTYTISNNTFYDGATAVAPCGGSGGTITLEFCP